MQCKILYTIIKPAAGIHIMHIKIPAYDIACTYASVPTESSQYTFMYVYMLMKYNKLISHAIKLLNYCSFVQI